MNRMDYLIMYVDWTIQLLLQQVHDDDCCALTERMTFVQLRRLTFISKQAVVRYDLPLLLRALSHPVSVKQARELTLTAVVQTRTTRGQSSYTSKRGNMHTEAGPDTLVTP